MEIITCAKCGRIFNYIAGPRICPGCSKQLEDKFAEVKKYVQQHPRIGLNELAEAMDVSIAQIRRWIREERLCFTDDSPIGIECEGCGVTIKTGRYCKQCKDKLSNGLSNAAGLNRPKIVEERKKRSTDNKMRFLDQ